jgi:hypothetical protein
VNMVIEQISSGCCRPVYEVTNISESEMDSLRFALRWMNTECNIRTEHDQAVIDKFKEFFDVL